MSANETNVARIGFDLRGLLAVTSVAAFVAMLSKIDLGVAVALGANFTASALMAHLYPVGSPIRYRAMGAVFLIGIVSTCIATTIQFFIFGSRMYLMWGTVLVACIGIVVGAAAVCRPSWMRWATRFLISILLLVVCYLIVHCFLNRDSISLSLRHDAYFLPRYEFTQEGSFLSQNWVLNRLRAAVGLAELFTIDFRGEFTATDQKQLFNGGSIANVHFSGCTVDLPTESLPQCNLDSVQFSSCKLRGKSLGTFVAASNSTYIDFADCQVESFEGLSAATNLRWINIERMSISDELIDEILKLPKLRGMNLNDVVLSESQLERLRADGNGLRITVQ
jgi:uncharacterized protein YjbI with pentapeptide repeats